MAARHGNLPVARLLVIHGADVNAKNLDEVTPLVLAAQEGKQDGCVTSSTSLTGAVHVPARGGR